MCHLAFQGGDVWAVDNECPLRVVRGDWAVLNEVPAQQSLELGLSGPTDLAV